MSVADRLNKLTTDITNAYTSIENKGGTIPANKNTNNLSTAIDSIEVIEQATAEGESLSLTNTKAMPYSDYVVKGKSEQNGEPSPSNPSEIHSVADDVNLLDIGTINDYKNYEDRADRVNWLTIENNKMICVVQDYGGTLAYNNNFYFKPNTTYSFSLVSSSNETRFLIKLRNLQDTDWLTDSDTSIAGWTYNSYYKGWFVTNAQQKTVNIPNCLFGVLGFGFNSTTETTGTTQTISNIKIQKGTIATPYSPYNQGTVTIKQRGKNLWNEELENAEYDTNGNKSTSTIWLVNKQGIEVNPNTTYTVSQQQTPSQYRIIFFNNNTYLDRINNVQNATEGYKNYTFTTPANCNKIYIQFRSIIENINQGSYVMIPSDITNIQLEQGSTATSYEPYQANDFIFQTSPLRSLPNGVKDSKDTKQHTRVGRIVLDGTQPLEIVNWRPTETSVGWVYPRSITNNKKQTEGVINNILCNKLKTVSYAYLFGNTVDEGINIVTQSNDYGLVIKTKDTSLTTANAINTYLSSNPITVQYELETEVIEPLTQNQATTMLDIIKTGSYEGTTNIYTDEDVKPTIKVDYYKKG